MWKDLLHLLIIHFLTRLKRFVMYGFEAMPCIMLVPKIWFLTKYNHTNGIDKHGHDVVFYILFIQRKMKIISP